MRGHEKIHEYRLQGKKIGTLIFINDFPCETDWDLEEGFPTISLDGDDPKKLDLRFLIGMTVTIGSFDEQRAKAIFDAVVAAKAKLVYAAHVDPYRRNTWYKLWSSK
jgi:hypothetical protein